MRITVQGHERSHGLRTLYSQRGVGHVEWDSEQGRIRLLIRCAPDAISAGSIHDMWIELSIRELAELVGWTAERIGNSRLLAPLGQVITMVMCGESLNKPTMFWPWHMDTGND